MTGRCGFCGASDNGSGYAGLCEGCVAKIKADPRYGDLIRWQYRDMEVRCTVELGERGVFIMFTGSPTGYHAIYDYSFNAQTVDRAYAHWEGYKESAMEKLTERTKLAL